MDSLMDTLIVPVALQMSADKNAQNRCHTVKLIEMMHVGIHASRMEEDGKREFILESIEISERLKL